MRTNNKIIIGIDPDVEKSGLFLIDMRTIDGEFYKYEMYELPFFSALSKIQHTFNEFFETCEVVVVIEQGELNKAIYVAKNAKNKSIAANIGMRVGKNFQVSQLLIEYCKEYSINHKTYRPQSKKWNAKFVLQFGIKKTNETKRDALRCAMSEI